MMLCACGCGQTFIPKTYKINKYGYGEKQTRFIYGHNRKGRVLSGEHKRKIALALKGRKYPNISESRKGEKNPFCKGDQVGIEALHEHLRKYFPPPSSCQDCGKQSTKLDLACVTGKYTRDISNFRYLCRSCHVYLDKGTGKRAQL
jgi:hypothetical protein